MRKNNKKTLYISIILLVSLGVILFLFGNIKTNSVVNLPFSYEQQVQFGEYNAIARSTESFGDKNQVSGNSIFMSESAELSNNNPGWGAGYQTAIFVPIEISRLKKITILYNQDSSTSCAQLRPATSGISGIYLSNENSDIKLYESSSATTQNYGSGTNSEYGTLVVEKINNELYLNNIKIDTLEGDNYLTFLNTINSYQCGGFPGSEQVEIIINSLQIENTPDIPPDNPIKGFNWLILLIPLSAGIIIALILIIKFKWRLR